MATHKYVQLLFVVVLSLSLQVAAREPKCPASRTAEMDACAARMGFLGDHAFVVPKNATAMSSFCDQLKESIACLQKYTRDCLSGFTRQLMTSLMKRGKNQYTAICAADDNRQEFMRKMACLSDDKIHEFHTCMDASIVRFEHIASSRVRTDQKLPSLCCSYQIFNRDLDNVLDKLCGKPSGSNIKPKTTSSKEYVQRIVGGTAGEFFALICEGHKSMGECRASSKTKQTLPKMEDLTSKTNAGKLAPTNKSLIPVLLTILDSTASASD